MEIIRTPPTRFLVRLFHPILRPKKGSLDLYFGPQGRMLFRRGEVETTKFKKRGREIERGDGDGGPPQPNHDRNLTPPSPTRFPFFGVSFALVFLQKKKKNKPTNSISWSSRANAVPARRSEELGTERKGATAMGE